LLILAKEYTQTNKIKYSIHFINSKNEILEIDPDEKIKDNRIADRYNKNATINLLGKMTLFSINKHTNNRKIINSEYPIDILIPIKLLKLKLVPTINTKGTA
jgi:hypothetical protein